MADNFLATVQATEEDAKALVSNAHKKAQTDLVAEEEKLKAARQTQLEQARAKAKEQLVQKQKDMRKVYEDLRKEGQRQASQLHNQVESKLDAATKGAHAYFLNELL